jgi:hypothetical protein
MMGSHVVCDKIHILITPFVKIILMIFVHVIGQRSLAKLFRAELAIVCGGSVALVELFVHLQIARQHECLCTEAAGKGFMVLLVVLFEFLASVKQLLADLTLDLLFVHEHMRLQVVLWGHLTTAYLAAERWHIDPVKARVADEKGFVDEALIAVSALKRLVPRVSSQMNE